MNTLSIPVVAMASISLYVGLYHLSIYFRRRQNREDLTFALLCFAIVFYDAFSVGLYNATSIVEGAGWQRRQFIVLAIFVTAFLWFVSDYTRQKPGTLIYLFSIFYLFALLVQLVDRSDFTFQMDRPSIKSITLPYVQPITYYEVALGPFSTVQSFMGIAASTYILLMGIRYFRRGYKQQAIPLILAIGMMYAAGFHDTLVSNGIYYFVYLIEYAYLAVILVMASSLSKTVVGAAIAKEELKKSEERFRSLVETTSDWVWEVDANGVYTYASPKVRALLGYEPEEIIGRTPFDLMPAEEAERVRTIFQNIVLHKKPIESLENVVCQKDGNLIILETSGVPFFDNHGRLVGYRGIDRDITERKKTEELINSERQRFQMILERMRVPTIISRLSDGQILYANQAIVEVSQVDLDKLIGFKASKFYTNPADRKTVVEALQTRGHIEDFEVQFRRTDGSSYWALLSSRTLDYEGEQCILSTYIDITERKHAEQALQAKTEELDRYFTSSLDLLCIADTDGYFRRLNPEWENTLGYTVAELEGQRFLEFVHPQDLEATMATISQLQAQQQILNFENRYRCKDGSYRWIEWRAFPIGKTIYAVARDITKRKRAEEALRESEQKFRLFVEQSSDGLVLTDEHGIIIEWNQAQEQLTGFKREESLSQPLWKVQPSFLPASMQLSGVEEQLKQKILVALQSGQADFLDKLIETAMFRRDGVKVIVQQVTFSIKTSQGYRLGSISRDITQLKQAEEELRASEERYRMLVEVSPIATWISKNQVIAYVNPAALQVLGATDPKEIVGKSTFDLIHPDYHPVVRERISQMMEKRKVVPLMEEKYVRLDGSIVDVEVIATPFITPEGTIIQVFFQDITKRKQAEEALRESEARHRALVESQIDLVSRYLPDTTLTFVNDAFCKFYGKTREELIGQSYLFMIAPEFREQVAYETKKLAEENGTITGEYLNYRDDGKECWIQWVVKSIRDENDRVLELQAVGRDITQLKQTEQALRESEEKLRQIASSLRETIWLRDVHTRQVLYVNPAFEELTGWTCVNFYERPDIVMNAIHPDDKEWVTKALAQRSEGVPYNKEHRITHRDGSVRWVSSRSFPVRNEAGEVYRWASIMEDITERKRAEAERERLIAELESKNAELERFTYTVSHDLKAPLITIRGFLGFIEKDAQSGNLDRLKGDIQRISTATDKMQRLLNELLELSRIGRVTNSSQNIPFRVLIDDVIKLMEGQLREKGVEVIIQDDLPVVSGDPQRLFEVLQNLVDNAVKFIANQTKPFIEIGTCGEEKNMTIFYIRDNGIGIAPEHHDRIFGLFNKLDPTAEGTGVGLAIVKRIIDLHGGRIWVESELGKGTTFYFTLPHEHKIDP